jgi:hypothetical protein
MVAVVRYNVNRAGHDRPCRADESLNEDVIQGLRHAWHAADSDGRVAILPAAGDRAFSGRPTSRRAEGDVAGVPSVGVPSTARRCGRARLVIGGAT